MDLKRIITRITSVFLIFSGVYTTFLSLNAIFFIYPYLSPANPRVSLLIQEGLVEKAILIYLIMVVDGAYGLMLLFKPRQEIKIIHTIVGILIVIASLFFIIQTPFTTDPFLNFLKQQLR